MVAKAERQQEECSALARKRRIERRQQQRADDTSSSNATGSGNKRPRPDDTEEAEKPKPSIVGIKRQARYEPGVPMTKEELVVWRKEARRVRNRESAAASRRKTRDRITELEGQLDGLQSRYNAAMERILELEAMNASLLATGSSRIQSDGEQSGVVSPCMSASSSPQYAPSVSPSSTPRASFVLDETQGEVLEGEQGVQHIIEMISRPNA